MLYDTWNPKQVLCDNLSRGGGMEAGEMRREMGGRFKREGTYVYLWLTQVDTWQKPTQHCKNYPPIKNTF